MMPMDYAGDIEKYRRRKKKNNGVVDGAVKKGAAQTQENAKRPDVTHGGTNTERAQNIRSGQTGSNSPTRPMGQSHLSPQNSPSPYEAAKLALEKRDMNKAAQTLREHEAKKKEWAEKDKKRQEYFTKMDAASRLRNEKLEAPLNVVKGERVGVPFQVTRNTFEAVKNYDSSRLDWSKFLPDHMKRGYKEPVMQADQKTIDSATEALKSSELARDKSINIPEDATPEERLMMRKQYERNRPGFQHNQELRKLAHEMEVARRISLDNATTQSMVEQTRNRANRLRNEQMMHTAEGQAKRMSNDEASRYVALRESNKPDSVAAIQGVASQKGKTQKPVNSQSGTDRDAIIKTRSNVWGSMSKTQEEALKSAVNNVPNEEIAGALQQNHMAARSALLSNPDIPFYDGSKPVGDFIRENGIDPEAPVVFLAPKYNGLLVMGSAKDLIDTFGE